MIQDPSFLKPLEKKISAPIIDAILRNDVPTLLILADEKPLVLWETYHWETLGGTVLHLATKLGHKEIVEAIIEVCPSLVVVTNLNGDTPLHVAARWGHGTIVTQILAAEHTEFTALNQRGETAFLVACRYNHPDAANLILEELPSITIGEFCATIFGEYTDLAIKILARFPNIAKEVDGKLSTPLHYACNVDSIVMVKMLLEIDEGLAERVNRDGITPLHLAIMRCSVAILEEFIDKAPASFNILTSAEETVFHIAAKHENIEVFIFMAENMINSSEILLQVDGFGNTVLHAAASSSCYPVILYIIYETTIDLSAKNNFGSEAADLVSITEENNIVISKWLKVDAKKIRDPQNHRNGPDSTYWGMSSQTELLERIKKLERQMIVTYRDPTQKEREMHAEALQSARNMITIVAILVASLAFTGGINPPGGVYQEGPSIGKSIAGKMLAFKIFSISNNIALFASLCIVVLLVSIIPYRTKPLMNFLVITHRMMWVAVTSMAIAYVAAAWVIVPHFRGTRWLFFAILAISSSTLGSLFVYLGYKLFKHMSKKTEWRRNMSIVPVVPTTSGTVNWNSAASDRGAADGEGFYIY
ncbi:PREDICTED: ankyrin repeat-containing protein At5g02620-like [Camelina sativa]|uniref:Ankyrin repeat-containing protein At5g02620-like n=1 Tax=Camelina sativa TaxID=90675 RepID=A0ABM0UZE8_CAMSA|nr:PREDICTED: ankyrin repeat-containing protein At5g02620-like [Camelina sativa]